VLADAGEAMARFQGRKFVDAVDGMLGEMLQDVAQINSGSSPLSFGGCRAVLKSRNMFSGAVSGI
jgi:hypothetical protein